MLAALTSYGCERL